MPDKHRSVVESMHYQRERDALIPHPVLADAALEQITTLLAQSPEIGQPTNRPDILAITTEDTPVLPAAVLYYAYDDQTVVLLSIVKADPLAWLDWFR